MGGHVMRLCFIAAAGFQAAGHSEEPLPDIWYEALRASRDEELRHRRLRGHFTKPLPAKPPAGGDPEEVHIFVIGDWGTFPGTGINMGSKWPTRQWNSWCFMGSRSEKEWREAKANDGMSADKVVRSWGGGRPICGSMHLECSWDKGGASKNDRCNPDKKEYWKDHHAQVNVATSMTDLARQRNPSFVINTADNFYYAGVEDTSDELWSMMFEELYPDESLQIPWLSSLGNHDYGGHDCDFCLWPTTRMEYDPRRGKPCSQAMIDYDTEHGWEWPNPKQVRWVLPMKGKDRWYMKSFKFPKANVTVDVFVIDTNKAHVSSQCFSSCPSRYQSACVDFFMQLWTRQRAWLLPALENSKADWKLVVGHAPPENFEASLMEEMRDRGVTVFMAGHVHQLRHDRHPSGIEAVISGSGGGYQSAGGGTAYTIHESQDYGFAAMHVEYHQITVEYHNDEGRRLWDPIVIPRVDVVQERIMKSLREAAIAVDAAAMKEQIRKAKEHGVDDSFINAAALAGLKAFEGSGGMAWVHMKPERMTSGDTTFSGFLSSWSVENSLPTDWTTLYYPRGDPNACCRKLQLPSTDAKTSVLCYPSPSCTATQMAGKVAQSGAAAMLLGLPKQDLEPLQADPNTNLTAEEASMPVLSIPSLPMKDLASWLANPAEKIGIQLYGGEGAFQAALKGARDAGVPNDVLEAAVREAEQRRAEEKLQAVMKSSDPAKIQEALDLALQFGAESDLIEQAKRKLTELQLEADLANIHANCNEFMRVHELIDNAKALNVGDTSAAETCRHDLAVKALHAAVGLGSGCEAPLAVAVAWCELAEVLSGTIQKAKQDCEQQVAEASRRGYFAVAAVAAVVILAGVCLVMSRKRAEAPPSQSPGGIELLETNEVS